MDTQKKREFQEKAKKIIENSISFIKKGFVKAEFVAEKTVEAGKLHYQHNRLESQLRHLYEKFGREAYMQANQSETLHLPLNAQLQAMLIHIRDTEEQILALKQKMHDISVTQTSHSSTQAPTL